MRLKLVHQLSLLLTGAALLAVLAVSVVVWWNLQAGFSDYIRARDAAQLDRLAQIIVNKSVDDPALEWLRGSRAGMESLLTEFRGFERQRPGVSGPPRLEGRPPRDDGRPPPSDRPRPPPTRPPSPDSIEGWIQIYSPHGEWLAGRPQSTKPSLVRLVSLHGTPIAEIRLFRSEQPSSVDAAFLQRQYWGLGLAGAAALLVSLCIGWLVAWRWVRPIKVLQQAAAQVAAGDLSVRTQATGALEMAQLMTDVNAMTASLEGLQKSRRLWIAQISHELRTPLSVLRGELEAVQDGARTANPALIHNLLEEVLHLGRLVGDLHTLSMADVGQLHCEFALQNVAPELRKITQRYAGLAAERGLQLDAPAVAATDEPAICANWDWRRIYQVLTNLFDNALRYTDAPGRIVVDWQVRSGQFHFTLEDSAPSVPEPALVQMFEPLFRADNARTRRIEGGGSGLGLAVAKAIVLAHQGSIVARVSGYGGVKIELILPLQLQE